MEQRMPSDALTMDPAKFEFGCELMVWVVNVPTHLFLLPQGARHGLRLLAQLLYVCCHRPLGHILGHHTVHEGLHLSCCSGHSLELTQECLLSVSNLGDSKHSATGGVQIAAGFSVPVQTSDPD